MTHNRWTYLCTSNLLLCSHQEISALGSAPFAAGCSRAVPMTEVAVLHSKGSSQGMVIRTASGISAPRDLLGKTVATITGR